MSNLLDPEFKIREVAERIRLTRESVGLSPKEMADKIGVSSYEYLAYEGGAKDFSFSFIYKFANACGVEITDLMEGESPHIRSFDITRAGQGLPIARRQGLSYLRLAPKFRNKIAEPYIRGKAIRHMEKGRVVIFGGGTGNPYFSTDSAAALRASEIGADALLKATKVDGIYTADPKKDPKAKKYAALKYETALEKRLKVMDSAAFALCMDNGIPIVVFDFFDKNALEGVVKGKEIGTIVS